MGKEPCLDLLVVLALFGLVQSFTDPKPIDLKLVVFTVATEETDGYKRFMRSAKVFNIDVNVVGMGMEWRGGDMDYAGGGFKVNLLRQAVKKWQDHKNTVLMYTDSYDLIFNSDAQDILTRFLKFDAKVLFSAEGFCWPDKALASKYPVVRSGKRYLNSGAFMGYAKEFYDVITHEKITDGDDDQLYYTKLFLDAQLREKLRMKLDTTSRVFQNINGAQHDLELQVLKDPKDGQKPVLRNLAHQTLPCVIHGNGPTKIELNHFANYLAKHWTPTEGCVACAEDRKSLDGLKDAEFPSVQLAVIIDHPTPFVDLVLEALGSLDYPRSRIHLFFYSIRRHIDDVKKFIDANKDDYFSIWATEERTDMDDRAARTQAVNSAVERQADYLFIVDGSAYISNKNTLKSLIQYNKGIVAPLLVQDSALFSNFWGALNPDGYYKRSDDYVPIVEGKRRGIWNMPYISRAILIAKDKLPAMTSAYEAPFSPSGYSSVGPDMSFAAHCRKLGHFMWVANEEDYGLLVNDDDFPEESPHPDWYQLIKNRKLWEKKYLNPDFAKYLSEEFKAEDFEQPCPDVPTFPLITDEGCKELIDIMEHFGQWSGGTNYDERLEGGYENVPTRDIHMKQVGLEALWLTVLKDYVRPIQEKFFIGYYSKDSTPEAYMNFVVRYKPEEQASLRPHHDASTYTLNMALNLRGRDYEGGGCRFLRYNCSVVDTRPGWVMLQPGRLTHMHEGLQTTKGTRYIMVSFIDP